MCLCVNCIWSNGFEASRCKSVINRRHKFGHAFKLRNDQTGWSSNQRFASSLQFRFRAPSKLPPLGEIVFAPNNRSHSRERDREQSIQPNPIEHQSSRPIYNNDNMTSALYQLSLLPSLPKVSTSEHTYSKQYNLSH